MNVHPSTNVNLSHNPLTKTIINNPKRVNDQGIKSPSEGLLPKTIIKSNKNLKKVL